MNKRRISLIIFLLLISGCQPKVVEKNKFVQKIDNFTMDMYSRAGEKIYSLNSPYSSFNMLTNTFDSNKTTINLYENQKTKYIINSDESKLSNNNRILKLTGNVELKTNGPDSYKILADNFIWNIEGSIYKLIGKVKLENKNIILSSRKAQLNSDNIIKFFNPVKYIIKSENNEGKYEINSENAFYDINTKSVRFSSKDKKVRSKISF